MIKFDYELIYLQSENARANLKDISHQLKKSSQRLKYSISMLEKERVIINPYCIFDYSYFGLILFRVYFKGVYINEKEKERMINELKDNLYIISIYELTGEFDLVIEFAFPNPSRFNKEFKKIITAANGLNDYKIILNLVTYIYPRNYMINNQNLQVFNMEKIIGGDRERQFFNSNEKKIIKNLVLNPKIRINGLARKSEINIKTAQSILRNLMKKNIIKGFKYNLDTNKLGIYKSRLFLKLHNLSLEKENEIMNYMLNVREIVQVNKTVGDWDAEIDIESFDKSKIRYLISEIRAKFIDLIERTNLIEFYRYYKRDYLPHYIFGEDKEFKDKLIIDLKK